MNSILHKINFNYQIKIQLLKVTVNDKFKYMRNPLGLFNKGSDYNDASGYFGNMKQKFKKLFNKSVLAIPLDEDEFDLRIDNDLFRQYYLQVQNVSDQSLSDYDYKRSIYHKYIQIQEFPIDKIKKKIIQIPNLEFSLSFYVQRTEFATEDNYAKLVQNILNSLSLWLNLCLFDFHTYVNRFLALFVHFYYCLISLRCWFLQILDKF